MRTLAIALLCGFAHAQANWVELAFSTRPLARERHAMVRDSGRGETVLFGGYNGAYLGDTWILDASGWQMRSTAAPQARSDHALAYDPVRHRVVLLGGYNGAAMSDVWEWDGSGWTQRTPSVTGVGNAGAACYDPVQGGVFYNRGTVNLLWNGTAAATVNVASPQGSMQHQMVFDAASGGVMTIDGQHTLRFTPSAGWQEVNTSWYFSLRQYAMAADPVSQRVIFHGGDGTVGSSTGPGNSHTFEWTGVLWSLIAQPGQPVLRANAMVFEPQRGFVMFGGQRDGSARTNSTWRLQETTTPASYVTFGSGCAGSTALTPRMAADTQWNSAPVLGGLFFVLIDQLPAGQLTLGFLGVSNQSWGGQPLPLSLQGIGMPGCDLLVAPEVTRNLGLSSTNGAVSWVTSVPNTASLTGTVFFQQAAVLAPGANAAGALTTNAGQGIVGIR